LTSGLEGVEWSASPSARFTSGEKARSTHWLGGWVDPRAGLDDVEKIKSSRASRESKSGRPDLGGICSNLDGDLLILLRGYV
jgi:hypothetical protein